MLQQILKTRKQQQYGLLLLCLLFWSVGQAATFTVTSTANNGPGTLNQAITDANANGNPGEVDIIQFNIATGGTTVKTIILTTTIPSITEPLLIDGTSQTGFSSTPVITIDDSGAAGSFLLFRILNTNNCEIRSINFSNVTQGAISVDNSTNVLIKDCFIGADATGLTGTGTPLRGIDVNGSGTITIQNCLITNATVGIEITDTDNFTIKGCTIGLDLNGTTIIDNGTGIQISNMSSDGTIGGLNNSDRNLISGNRNIGISITQDSDDIKILGNFIGTDITGSQAKGNNFGISMDDASRITIGDSTTANGRNIIAGNLSSGISIDGTSIKTKIFGNYIGTDITGIHAIANGGHGIKINELGADSTFIGADTHFGRNVIAGNTGSGIYLENTEKQFIKNNFIGVDASGTTVLGNGEHGIYVEKGNNIFIGGIKADEGNVVSGNTKENILIIDNVVGAILYQNIVGLDSTGGVALTNPEDGIQIQNANGAIIGASGNGRNIISGNQNGIVLFKSSNNTIENNYIGTDQTGTKDLGNIKDGVLILDESNNNTVGGIMFFTGNLISGNDESGILVISNSDQNKIFGNIIGLDATGASALGNSQFGVSISTNSDLNIIGDTFSGKGNIISANTSSGVIISVQSDQNIVQNNLIGTDITGSVDLGNGQLGIYILEESNQNKIGTATFDGFNLIAGNDFSGVRIENSSNENIIINNIIGLDILGTSALSNGNHGVLIMDNSLRNEVGQTIDFGRNIISENSTHGVRLLDSDENVVSNNFIGLGIDASTTIGNLKTGINITGSNNSKIGLDHFRGRNVIAGNQEAGITLFSNAQNNELVNNYIGTDSLGTTAKGNAANGIFLEDSPNNNIGLANATRNNLISGNTGVGISLNGATTNISIFGNIIGTDVNGTADLGNTGDGIKINDNITNVTISTNLISGNNDDGIHLQEGVSNVTIDTNKIGTNIGGTADLGNSDFGIVLVNAVNNCTISKNLISGNNNSGIVIQNTVSNIAVDSNKIGTDFNGTIDLGNTNNGILFLNQANNCTISNNLISGNDANGIFAGDTVSTIAINNNKIGTDINGTADLGNVFDGIFLSDSSRLFTVTNNLLSGNDDDGIACNGKSHQVKGNLVGTTITGLVSLPNTDDGVVLIGDSTTVGGSAFLDRNIISGNSGTGVVLDEGNANIVQNNFIGIDITGGATLQNGSDGIHATDNSSKNQFIGNVISGNRFDGLEFQNNATRNIVIQNIIGLDSTGTIKLPNGDNGIEIGNADDNIIGTVEADRNVISGNTGHGILLDDSDADPDSTLIQGNYIGVSLDGLNALGNDEYGISIQDGTNTFIQLGNVIADNGSGGIDIRDDNTVIRGNFIGTDKDGNNNLGNTGHGIETSSSVDGLLIGGDDLTHRNIIANNTKNGIEISGVDDFKIINNYIGTNFSFDNLGNQEDNIIITGGPDLGLIQDNVIGHSNTGNGIFVNDVFLSDSLLIAGNFIGTDLTGTLDLGNALRGIDIIGTEKVFIGGDDAEDANTIAFNRDRGINIASLSIVFGGSVFVVPSDKISIFGNHIYSNSPLGIDYNDPNNGQPTPPMPQITAVNSRTPLNVTGTLNGDPNTKYRIEFFTNSATNNDGNFEGQRFIDKIFIVTDGSGSATFNANLDGTNVSNNDQITATATADSGNTSPFSSAVVVPLPVELLSFTATPKTNHIELTWATVTEIDNDGFEIERSLNGVNWEMIDFVQGNGTTTIEQEYSYQDYEVKSNIWYYYRLRQVDFDGQFDYSNIVLAQIQGKVITKSESIKIYPNPAKTFTNIHYSNLQGENVRYQILNINGQIVQQGQLTTPQLSVEQLSAGTYLIQLLGANGQQLTQARLVVIQ